MKRVIAFLGIIASTMTVSCNRRTEISGMQSNEIVFGVENGMNINVTTKAVTETTAGTLENNGFRVSASIYDLYDNEWVDNLFDNIDVIKIGDVWKDPAMSRFYPAGDYTFCFYAAYSSYCDVSIDDVDQIVYDYKLDTSDDFVTAFEDGIEAQSTPVHLTFNHALAQASFSIKGADTDVEYKLNRLSVKFPSNGDFEIRRNRWDYTNNTKSTKTIFSGTKSISTSASSPIGETMTFLPGKIELTANWTCYIKGTSTVAAQYEKTAELTLTQGVKSFVEILLPDNDAAKITFTVTVNPWETERFQVVMGEL